ncbi:MAG TPA: HAD family phosphatase [Streptosporangiaceae bacterium]|nr:HAD family phosphatase [Streptosporangiaceae bacterium]
MTATPSPPSADRFRAVVFDLDGTLVDSEARSHASWRHVFETLGIPPDDALIRSFVGRRGIDVHGLLKDRLPEHDPGQLMAASSAHFHAPHHPPLGPLRGAVELVRLIGGTGIPLGLVTSAGRRYAERTLTQLGVHSLFSVVVTAEDVTVGKPDPEGYRAACRALDVAPACCVVFEDAPAGVAAAKAAGTYCVAVATTHAAGDLAAADVVVPDLTAVSWPLPSN